MNKRGIISGIMLLLVLLASIAFVLIIDRLVSDDEKDEQLEQTQQEETPDEEDNQGPGPTSPSPTEPDGNQDFVNYVLEIQEYSFTPNLIEAEPGEVLKIKLVNKGGMHSVIIDELGISTSTLFFGEEETITITIPSDASGKTYEFYCGISNHRELGMVGTIKVR